jgi:hypothetical protein
VSTLSYVCEFNVRADGPDAEPFLLNALRTWPELYAELKGVKGTRLLANAFGLAGEFNYEWRVDIESLATLDVIDKALKSDDHRWREARSQWFANRTQLRARLLQRAEDESDDIESGEGLLYFVTAYQASSGGLREARSSVSAAWRGLAGVVGVEHYGAVVRPFYGYSHESSARLNDIADLDQLVESNGRLGEVVGPAPSRLFSELREVDGALISGA